MDLTVLGEKMVILKGNPSEEIPSWVFRNKNFTSITYTDEELSIVCPEEVLPGEIDMIVERGWRCIKVIGPLDFTLIGILSSLASTLSKAEISIFVVSTYNTDYVLIREDKLEKAMDILIRNGHNVTQD